MTTVPPEVAGVSINVNINPTGDFVTTEEDFDNYLVRAINQAIREGRITSGQTNGPIFVPTFP